MRLASQVVRQRGTSAAPARRRDMVHSHTAARPPNHSCGRAALVLRSLRWFPQIADVCSLTKMTNLIPKQLSPHKLSKLALIQFDVAGPFPISLRGNRSFMLIIDSWTREEWVLCLKQKSDAQKALMTWKTDTEFQVDAK